MSRLLQGSSYRLSRSERYESYLENAIASHSPDAQEIQMAKDRSEELIDKILRRSKVILDGLLRVAKSLNTEQLKDVEGKLQDYKKYGAQSYSSCSLSPTCPLQSPRQDFRSS